MESPHSKPSSAIKRLSSRLLDQIYPPSCHLCNDLLTHGRYLCPECAKKLPKVKAPFCRSCGEPFDGNISAGEIECPNCHGRTFHFNFAIAALRDDSDSRTLIWDLKYGKQRYLAPEIARLCAEKISADPRFREISPDGDWIITPVPLHWRRQFMRTFNQSELIASNLSKATQLPHQQLLKRIRYTTTQTRLSRQNRLSNLKDAFTLKQPPAATEGRKILLIDDVFTTGSTAEECSRILKDEGKAENIVVLSALRG